MGSLDPLAGCECQDTTGDGGRCGGTLPDSPDCAINYHFGMLLGVDDFRTEQGFHVGRLRRHQRALHGHGVVYGYAVSFDPEHAEMRVEAGYALDRRGRDLYLDAAQCLGLPAWWEKHRDDDVFADADKEDVTFDADVLLCYRTCLARPVPAIADPCAGSSVDIAYSRICESVQLSLVPRRGDEAPPGEASASTPPYHLLRLLTGLDQPLADAEGHTRPDDEWLAQRMAEIAALPATDRSAETLELWQAVIARAAAGTTDPTNDPPWAQPADLGDGSGGDTTDCLVIARLSGIHIIKGPQGWQAAVDAIDIDQRMTLLPVQMLQTELIRPDVAGAAAPPAGPVIVEGSAAITDSQVELRFDKPLAPASVSANAFAVTEFLPATGWASFTLGAPAYVETDHSHSITLPLDRVPTGSRVRVTIYGTGPTPLLGADLIPAGAVTADGDGANLSITISGE